MSAIVKMVVPPIYRLEFSYPTSKSNWGWHRAVDILEAANNILALQGKDETTALNLCARFPFVDPGNNYSVVSNEGQLFVAKSGRNEWLKWAVEQDAYLPAKLGLQLLNAVKHPVISEVRVIAKALSEI